MNIQTSRRHGGFTLVEIMVTVAIVAILAAIALPNYRDSVRRAKVQGAVAALSDGRTKMEQWYQDNRFYTTTAASTACGVTGFQANEDFSVTCTAADNQSYLLTATGAGAMSGFIYTINQANAVSTVAPAWDITTAVPRWVKKKGE